MIKRLVVREVRDCWQAALLLVRVPLAQVLHRLGKLSEWLLLEV
jgi:hypothetical protein